MSKTRAIAIDGPVAAGKTAVGQLVAKRLGFRFLDTGAMYRAATWAAQSRRIDMEDEEALVKLATELPMSLVPANGGERLIVDSQDITGFLRDPQVERGVSLVAKVPGVRVALVGQQRRIASNGDIVMAGRDIGTVVLTEADVKVFLTASVQVRAKRRHSEMQVLQNPPTYEQVLADLIRRDKIDSEREDSPLRPADDATVIDTDNISIDELVQKIICLVGRN